MLSLGSLFLSSKTTSGSQYDASGQNTRKLGDESHPGKVAKADAHGVQHTMSQGGVGIGTSGLSLSASFWNAVWCEHTWPSNICIPMSPAPKRTGIYLNIYLTNQEAQEIHIITCHPCS